MAIGIHININSIFLPYGIQRMAKYKTSIVTSILAILAAYAITIGLSVNLHAINAPIDCAKYDTG